MFLLKGIMILFGSILWVILWVIGHRRCSPSLTSFETDTEFTRDFDDECIDDVAIGKGTSSAFSGINTPRTSGTTDEVAPRISAVAPRTVANLPSYVSVTDPIGSSSTSVTGPSNADAISEVDVVSRSYYDYQNLKTSRDKRSLTFPDPSTILLIFGLGTPLQLDRESIIVGAFTKMIYNLPLNATDFTEPGGDFSRTKSRWSIYRVLERAAELYGFGAGKGCLLRAVCEVAASPFDLRHGLFGQMVQAFLTAQLGAGCLAKPAGMICREREWNFRPSSTSERYDEYGDREYHAAERLGGNANENCHVLYPECERSVLDVFSITETTKTTTTTTQPAR